MPDRTATQHMTITVTIMFVEESVLMKHKTHILVMLVKGKSATKCDSVIAQRNDDHDSRKDQLPNLGFEPHVVSLLHFGVT